MTSSVSKITNSAPWRWTIGRVSNLARVPINLVVGALQGLKFLGKGAALVVTVPFNWIRHKGKPYDGCWSPNGVKMDGIMCLAVIKATIRCFCRAVVAPSVKDSEHDGFWDGIENAGTVLLGYHFDYFKRQPTDKPIHVTAEKVDVAWKELKHSPFTHVNIKSDN